MGKALLAVDGLFHALTHVVWLVLGLALIWSGAEAFSMRPDNREALLAEICGAVILVVGIAMMAAGH